MRLFKDIARASARRLLAREQLRWISSGILRDEGAYFLKKCDNRTFAFYPADAVGESLLRHGEYQRDIVAKLAPFLPSRPLKILELGAHIGTQTTYFFDYLNVQEVIAVEPDPENRWLLEINIQLNQLDKVRVEAKAVSERSEKLLFSKPRVNSARCRVISPGSLDNRNEGETLWVEAEPAENICGNPDFVWIDVEEHEISVLKGMTKIIRNKTPILLELSRQALSDHDFDYFVNDVLPHYSTMRAYEKGFQEIEIEELEMQQYNILLS